MKLLIEELDRELPWGWVLLRREPSTKLSDGLIEMRFTGDINLIEQNILLAKQTASLEKSIEKVWAVLQKREPMISGHVAYATERIIASLEKELDARTEELSAASERAALAENWAADSMEELEECREKLGDALEINENQAKALVDYDAWAQRHRSVICGYKVGSEAFWRDTMTCPNSPDGHHLYLVYEKFGIRCEHCSHTLGWRDVLNYCNAAERLSAEDAFDASTRLYDVDYASIAEEWRDQNSKRQHESLHDYATHRKDE